MRDITSNLPRDEVIRLWKNACNSSLAALHFQQDKPIKILSCHLTLYSGRRGEFYSAVQVESFERCRVNDKVIDAHPTHLILLIDDIYDMYTRLTKQGELFEMPRWEEGQLRTVWDDEDNPLSDEPAFRTDIQNRLRLEVKQDILSILLDWRHSEMLMGELLARQLRRGSSTPFFTVFGAKQPTTVARRWFLMDRPTTVYLSHPISRPRRQWRAARKDWRDHNSGELANEPDHWPLIVDDFNRVQADLAERDVVAIMPTAIDEFRFGNDATRPLARRRPPLDARWRIAKQGLLYTPPANEAPDYPGLFNVAEQDETDTVEAMLRSLERQVLNEMPFRDHLLVASNAHLLVYRPLYTKPAFSGGVRAEVHHWGTLARWDEHRRAVFVHFAADLEPFADIAARLPRNDILALRNLISGSAQRYLVIEKKLSEDAARDILAARPTRENLDRGPSVKEVDSRWALKSEALTVAANNALQVQLTSVNRSVWKRVGIWIVSDSSVPADQLGQMADFLKFQHVAVPPWQPVAWQAVGESPADWADKILTA